jgi:alpha-beta hydrolase superfamily lysophospholipase
VNTRVFSNLPPLPRAALPAAAHHRVEVPGFTLNVTQWPAPENARHAVVLLPGAGGHVGAYGVLAAELSARGLHVLGVDPPGHGVSSGARGGVDLPTMTRALSAACQWVVQHTGLPVCLLGVSLGGEWALHVHLLSPHVTASICHTLLLPTLLPLNAGVRLLQTRAAARFSSWIAGAPVPVSWWVDARKVLLDVDARQQRARDPLNLSRYTLAAWRSLFSTPTPWPPGANHKPVLVMVGERDEVVPPAHVLRCFMALGGPKALHVVPGAAHHLALENAPALADAARDFLDNLRG